MKAYSEDLRERVVKACDAGTQSRQEIAERFAVCTRWIRKLLRQRRETGSIAAKPHGGGHPPAFDSHTSQRLAKEVDEDSDATLDELRERCGVFCSIQAVSTTLLKLGLTRKKRPYAPASRTART
jgi:transposase